MTGDWQPTVAWVGATTSTCPITRFMAALLPIILKVVFDFGAIVLDTLLPVALAAISSFSNGVIQQESCVVLYPGRNTDLGGAIRSSTRLRADSTLPLAMYSPSRF